MTADRWAPPPPLTPAIENARTVNSFIDPRAAATEHDRLVIEMTNLCARFFKLADSNIALPFRPTDALRHGDSAKSGLLAAAVEMRDALGKFRDSRESLKYLGFEPSLQDIERE